ncbi:Phosphate transport system permease protein PstC (TC 3.A.1.7.1) [hydrothermal vent metagenome]|uniref:Phosphate transport system permease protein PstC (TC 3.A.1.7.1) n=1 Tax=hydrothermal vent metagenome TaxID=652676 RepID=A0A3B1DJQ8_9ZZZZ
MTSETTRQFSVPFLKKRKVRWGEETIHIGLFLSSILSVVTTFLIIGILFSQSYHFFKEVSLWDFLTGTEWSPMITPRAYGVLPLVCGTLQIVLGSALIAIPVGLSCAIYLREYASERVRYFIKPILEILAGIPTIVYGYIALMALTPMIKIIFPQTGTFNAVSASIVVGVMILPMIASLCDDALRAVPNSLREGAYALGATSFEVTTQVVVPSALSGIVASFVLAASRAIGETMAVSLAAGITPVISANPFQSIQTMTSAIVEIAKGDAEHGTTEYYSLFAVAILLFTLTLGMNLLSNKILHRFREVYE